MYLERASNQSIGPILNTTFARFVSDFSFNMTRTAICYRSIKKQGRPQVSVSIAEGWSLGSVVGEPAIMDVG